MRPEASPAARRIAQSMKDEPRAASGGSEVLIGPLEEHEDNERGAPGSQERLERLAAGAAVLFSLSISLTDIEEALNSSVHDLRRLTPGFGSASFPAGCLPYANPSVENSRSPFAVGICGLTCAG